ncbi:MAG: LbtU family siderophore porin [Deltaproteobacteria bacterium]|nr:LbtU family siderophore porin [Deltaproteobacteria bacterium]
MKKRLQIMLCLLACGFLFPHTALAEEISNYELMQEIRAMKQKIEHMEKQLEQKDMEIEEIKSGKDPGASDGAAVKWLDRITFSGAVELDYGYADDRDTGDNRVSDSTSDMDIGTVELGAEIALHEYVTGNVLFKAENLDADDNVFCDEATITLGKEGFPLYFVGGKRAQPFGVFESHLISDPLTQDLYEIADTGATFGFAPGVYGMDISATLYRGEVLMTRMLEGAYGLDRTYLDDTGALPGWREGGMDARYDESDGVSSFIGNITMEPMEGMAAAIFYDSEPGDGKRNTTLGGMFHFEISGFTLDAEYITALGREEDAITGKEHKESALVGSVAYYVTDDLEVAARYETFEDDIQGDQDSHLDYRYALGCTYTLFKTEDFSASLMGEYRKSRFERQEGSPTDDGLNEFFARLAIEF